MHEVKAMPASRPESIDERTPLMLAACGDDLCSLLEHILGGAGLNAETSQGWTALTYAAYFGHYHVAEQLLDAGADPNHKKSYAMADTPLSIAAAKGHFSVVRLLIQHGADPACYAGLQAARAECFARQNNHLDIAHFLRQQEDLKHTELHHSFRDTPSN